jgi:hypothetical protein
MKIRRWLGLRVAAGFSAGMVLWAGIALAIGSATAASPQQPALPASANAGPPVRGFEPHLGKKLVAEDGSSALQLRREGEQLVLELWDGNDTSLGRYVMAAAGSKGDKLKLLDTPFGQTKHMRALWYDRRTDQLTLESFDGLVNGRMTHLILSPASDGVVAIQRSWDMTLLSDTLVDSWRKVHREASQVAATDSQGPTGRDTGSAAAVATAQPDPGVAQAASAPATPVAATPSPAPAALGATPASPVPDGTHLLQVGDEVVGDIAAGVMLGKRRHATPIAAYRFAGRKGQRYCVRVASDDAYIHAYIDTKPRWDNLNRDQSWTWPWYTDIDAQTGAQGRRTATIMSTFRNDRERVLFLVGHKPVEQVQSGRRVLRYASDVLGGYGTYALQVWDPDYPEPVATDPRLAASRHPRASDAVWLGDLADVLDRPWLTSNAVGTSFSLVDGRLVQKRVSMETGNALPDWIFDPTGRRGEYRLRQDGRILQIQCDGSWTLTGDNTFLHVRVRDGEIRWDNYTDLHRLHTPARYVTNRSVSKWVPLTDANVAAALNQLAQDREYARISAEARARNQAEEDARRHAMVMGIIGGFASGLSSAQASQQRMEDGFRQARASGVRQGLATRAAMNAAEARARLVRNGGAQGNVTPPGDSSAAPVADAAKDGGLSLTVTGPDAPAETTSSPAPAKAQSLFAYCIAKLEFREGQSGKPVLYLSGVAEFEFSQKPDDARLAESFRSRLPPRVSAPLCGSTDSRASAEDIMLGSVRQHPGWEVVRTGVAPGR